MATMLHAARNASLLSKPIRLPDAVGLIAGLALPLLSAALFSTYVQLIKPDAVENARHQGYVYLAAESALILYARRRGFDPVAIFGALPAWARAALALFVSTFWISSVLVSWLPSCSVMLSVGWFIQLLFGAAVFHLFRTTPIEEIGRVWHGLMLGLVALALVTLTHFTVLPASLVGREREVDWAAAIPGFISVRHFGSWVAAVLALTTGIAWIDGAGERGRRMLYLAIAFAFSLMFWTATRAAVLGWACVLPVAWAVAGQPRSRRFLTVLPMYIIAAAGVALLLQPYGHPAYTLFREAGVETPDAFSSGRLTLWRNSLAVAMDYPLLGTGAGSSWWLVSLNGGSFVQPHNALVQFLLNWGLIPTLPAVALLGSATWYAHVAARRNRALLPFLLMLDCLLAMSMLEGMLHFAQFIMLIMGCLAICLGKLHGETARGA